MGSEMCIRDRDQRQGFKRKNKGRSGIGFRKREFPASQIAEGEGRTRGRGLFDRADSPIEQRKEILEDRNLEQDQRQRNLDGETGEDDLVADGAPVLADQPGETRQEDESDNALQVHEVSDLSPGSPFWGDTIGKRFSTVKQRPPISKAILRTWHKKSSPALRSFSKQYHSGLTAYAHFQQPDLWRH